MAELGEIKSARELGRSSTYRNTNKYIWHACVNCGKESWAESFIQHHRIIQIQRHYNGHAY